MRKILLIRVTLLLLQGAIMFQAQGIGWTVMSIKDFIEATMHPNVSHQMGTDCIGQSCLALLDKIKTTDNPNEQDNEGNTVLHYLVQGKGDMIVFVWCDYWFMRFHEITSGNDLYSCYNKKEYSLFRSSQPVVQKKIEKFLNILNKAGKAPLDCANDYLGKRLENFGAKNAPKGFLSFLL